MAKSSKSNVFGGNDGRKTKVKTNDRKYPVGLGGFKHKPGRTEQKRQDAQFRQLDRDMRTVEEQLTLIAARPGESKKEFTRLFATLKPGSSFKIGKKRASRAKKSN